MNYPVPREIEADLRQMGFQHGQKGVMRGSYCNNQTYLTGWREGRRLCCCSIPDSPEAPLERGWGDELLNEIV